MAKCNDGNRAQKLGSRLIENNLRLEMVTDVERLFSLKPHWDNLCHRSNDCNFTQSFQWCSAAWNMIGRPQRRQLLCLVGWVNNKMVLIWPLVIQRRALWFVLRPLGSETTEYSDVLVENSSEADHWVTLAWQKLRTTRNGDIIILPFVRANSRLHRIISQERPMSVWVTSISSVSWDGYQDWESYYQSLKGDFRHSLRRTRRRLAQRGNLSFDAVTKPEEFRPVINWLFSHKAEWLVRTKQDGPWRNAELYKEFLIHVAAEREAVGDVTLFVLKLDGQIISAGLVRNSKFSAEAVIAAFDRTYSKYGPGQLLCEDILKWAFKRRLEFDFRIGNEPYKRHWINRESTVATYRFINSIWGEAFSLASRFRAIFKSFRC